MINGQALFVLPVANRPLRTGTGRAHLKLALRFATESIARQPVVWGGLILALSVPWLLTNVTLLILLPEWLLMPLAVFIPIVLLLASVLLYRAVCANLDKERVLAQHLTDTRGLGGLIVVLIVVGCVESLVAAVMTMVAMVLPMSVVLIFVVAAGVVSPLWGNVALVAADQRAGLSTVSDALRGSRRAWGRFTLVFTLERLTMVVAAVVPVLFLLHGLAVVVSALSRAYMFREATGDGVPLLARESSGLSSGGKTPAEARKSWHAWEYD